MLLGQAMKNKEKKNLLATATTFSLDIFKFFFQAYMFNQRL
jgi:hypothetical protein